MNKVIPFSIEHQFPSKGHFISRLNNRNHSVVPNAVRPPIFTVGVLIHPALENIGISVGFSDDIFGFAFYGNFFFNDYVCRTVVIVVFYDIFSCRCINSIKIHISRKVNYISGIEYCNISILIGIFPSDKCFSFLCCGCFCNNITCAVANDFVGNGISVIIMDIVIPLCVEIGIACECYCVPRLNDKDSSVVVVTVSPPTIAADILIHPAFEYIGVSVRFIDGIARHSVSFNSYIDFSFFVRSTIIIIIKHLTFRTMPYRIQIFLIGIRSADVTVGHIMRIVNCFFISFQCPT